MVARVNFVLSHSSPNLGKSAETVQAATPLSELPCFECGGEGEMVELRSGHLGTVLCTECRGSGHQ